jgi:hypothetical protein
MKTMEFLESLVELVRQQLPPQLQDFTVVGPTRNLVKIHYGIPAVHYEVWVQRRRWEMEIGLHFESDRLTNIRYMELLKSRVDEIKFILGPRFSVENWDRGWTRAHETVVLEAFTDDFVVESSFKLSSMMRTLEPILTQEANSLVG